MAQRNSLFSEGDLFATLENQKKKARAAANEISAQQMATASDEQLVDHVCSQFSIEPLALYPERADRAMSEAQFETRDSVTYDIPHGGSIRVPGVLVTVRVPYTGDPALFRLSPSMFSMGRIRGDVTPPNREGLGYVTFSLSFNQHGLDDQAVTKEIERVVSGTVSMANNQRVQLEQYHGELKTLLKEVVAQRRGRLGSIHSLAKALDIPVVQRPGTPSFAPIPVHKKATKALPPAADATQAQGFAITDETYAVILQAIRAQGRTFEKTPTTFTSLSEEDLRNLILANLNTHFQGGATGETFRKRGKTDICIEQEDRAAFIGECKVWRGPKELVEGLHQLLGYLTWRDCKTALIVFNKDRGNFSEILERAPAALRGLSGVFVSERQQEQPGEWRMLFKAPSDSGRIVTVQLMLYDIVAKPAT